MVIDYHGVRCCYSHRCRSRGWSLASPRAHIACSIYNNQVRVSNRSVFFFAYFYSPPVQSPTASLNPVTTSSPKSTSAAQSILDDTSLAALVLPGGDRHFFFQDNNGFIRRAVRSASENQWTISSPLNLSSNPKSLTPLTASVYDAIEVEDEGVLGPIVVNI